MDVMETIKQIGAALAEQKRQNEIYSQQITKLQVTVLEQGKALEQFVKTLADALGVSVVSSSNTTLQIGAHPVPKPTGAPTKKIN